jgi:hypothetical protein
LSALADLLSYAFTWWLQTFQSGTY